MAAARSVWKGFLQFSLVTIPVRAYTAAATGGGGIALNQLHQECHSRIKYKKTCPIHGEVPSSEIVSGYEFAEEQYVVVDPSEVEKLRTKREKSIEVESFIPHDAVEPRFYSGKTYFLLPDGQPAYKPYNMLIQAMDEANRYGFAEVAWNGGRKQLILLRPVGRLLAMTMVSYPQELRPAAEFEADVVTTDTPPAELKLAKSVIDALSVDDFNMWGYRDDYQDKLTELVEAKINKKQIVEPTEAEETPMAINLMESLERSIEAAKKKQAARKKPAKLVAPSSAGKAGQARRRKSS